MTLEEEIQAERLALKDALTELGICVRQSTAERARAEDAEARLRVVRQIVDAYLVKGEGTGARSICLRIVQALEAT